MTIRFQLKNAALILALASAYPLQAYAAAGVAQFSAGDVTVRRGAAGAGPLSKGGNIESGDLVETGATGRAQLRFSDGGIISLQPGSQFKIDNYADTNDGKQDRFLVDLLRGGMRAITGLIGKRNRDNYKVNTATATIGIRGSGFNLSYNPDGSLSVVTELDEIEVCTLAGCIGLTAGEVALVLNNRSLPQRTLTRPSTPLPPTSRTAEVAGDGARPEGTSLLISEHTTSNILTGIAFSSSGLIHSGEGSARVDQRQYVDGALTRDTDGRPTNYLAQGNVAAGSGSPSNVVSTGSVAAGDLLIIGNWGETATWQGAAPVTLDSSAFVAGIPTPSSAVSYLQGQRAEYALSNATSVFSSDGYAGELLNTSKLTADFLGAGNYVDVSLDVSMPGDNLQEAKPKVPGQQAIGINTTPLYSTSYQLRGGATGTGAGFSGVLSVSSSACIDADSRCGTGTVNGFFSGNNAQNAGISYGASSDMHGEFGGAATFSRGSLTSVPTNTQTNDGYPTVIGAVITDGSGVHTDDNYHTTFLGFDTLGGETFNFSGVGLRSIVSGQGSNSRTVANGSESAVTSSSVGQPTDTDFIGWGMWQAGSVTAGYSTSAQMLDYVHYVVGKPTSQMPNTGSASYSLLGGTTPTATLNGQTTMGQLLSTSSLSVNFGNGRVDADIYTRFGATEVSIRERADISGSTFSTYGCGNNGFINGLFTGTNAFRAGLTYGTFSSGLGNIRGAAAFQRTSGNAFLD